VARHRLNEDDVTEVLETVGGPDGSGPSGDTVSRRWLPRKVRVSVAAGAVFALVATVAGLALGRSRPTAIQTDPVPSSVTGENATPTQAISASPTATQTVTATPTPQHTVSPSTVASPSLSPTPTPTPEPAPAELVVGTTRSLESISSTGAYLATNGSYGNVISVTADSAATTKQAATFTVVAGLADASCVTFRASNGSYLRHRNFRLRLDPFSDTSLFRQDATFCPRAGSITGSLSFESVNYPGSYLHGRGTEVWLDELVDTAAFRAESSFRVTYALA
jgi:hypothetical protein